MSQILALIATPEIGIGLGFVILALGGLILVNHISRGRIIASLTKERDELHATANRLRTRIADEEKAYNKAASLVVEVNNKGAGLEAALIEIYEIIVNEAKRQGIMKDKSIIRALDEGTYLTADFLTNIAPDVKTLAEQVIALNVEDLRQLDAHGDKIREEIVAARAEISYGGYILTETGKNLGLEAKVEREGYVHFNQVCTFNRMSTICLYLKMSAEDYAGVLDKIIARDRHVLRRFLEQDPHIVHSYPADYILAVRRLAS